MLLLDARAFLPLMGIMLLGAGHLGAEPYKLHRFDRQQLTDTYYSEGVHVGDLNRDGVADVVYGPYWFEGPAYTTRHEIYEPKPQNPEAYADNFFSWIYDFDGDGWNDVLVVGFPGTPAFVYQNPTGANLDRHWPKHQVFDRVSNEAPQFTNIVGDDRPELVCTRDGFYGYATVNWDEPFELWPFHAISAQIAAEPFQHGLGVGDIDGDGRLDVIHAEGWLEQPEQNAGRSRWRAHATAFSNSYGGADMHAYDVDGDGDNDVVTSHAAHHFGLGWYEQRRDDAEITFEHHLIMGAHPAENDYGVVFSELHSVKLADVDGDKLKDIVTGKTYYSHHQDSPMWDAGAVVYWFRLVRREDGVQWVPYQADGDTGIGRKFTVVDTNGDGLQDIVVGGMKGAHVLINRRQKVDQATWRRAQPPRYQGQPAPSVEGAEPPR